MPVMAFDRDFDALAQTCAPAVDVITVRAIVQQESGGNPFAIGVVDGALVRQPDSLAEAVVTARQLADHGHNFSVGLAQINRMNLHRLGLSLETALDPCENLRAMQRLLHDCWLRARASEPQPVRAALSCYYSGSFAHQRFAPYVDSVVAHARTARLDEQRLTSGQP